MGSPFTVGDPQDLTFTYALTDDVLVTGTVSYVSGYGDMNGDGVNWPSSDYDPDGNGGWPTDNCDNIMNVDNHITGNSLINILDVVYLINYIYKEGPDPECPYSL